MKRNTLTILPQAGLANRMLVIGSALDLARDSGADVKCIWMQDEGLACPFDQLFEPMDGFRTSYDLNHLPHVVPSSGWKRCRNLVYNKMMGIDLCLKNEAIMNMVGWIDPDHPKVSDYRSIHDCILDALKDNRNVYAETWQMLSPDVCLEGFRPIQALRDKIDVLSNRFDSHTYGVHIRRTDHIQAIEESPLELFVDSIAATIDEDPTASFYLTTDDLPTDGYIKMKFGDRIITRPKVLDRNSVEGIQDALVDIWLLSRTAKIFGSFYSTFSKVASLVGGIELVIMRRKI